MRGSAGRRWAGGARRALLAGLLAAAACAGPRRRVAEPDETAWGEAFVLTLNNRHWLDVNVFVQHDGEASRVGMVTASSSASLVLPRWLLGDAGLIRIIAEPVGAEGRFTTEPLRVELGQEVVLNVESTLSQSNYSVR